MYFFDVFEHPEHIFRNSWNLYFFHQNKASSMKKANWSKSEARVRANGLCYVVTCTSENWKDELPSELTGWYVIFFSQSPSTYRIDIIGARKIGSSHEEAPTDCAYSGRRPPPRANRPILNYRGVSGRARDEAITQSLPPPSRIATCRRGPRRSHLPARDSNTNSRCRSNLWPIIAFFRLVIVMWLSNTNDRNNADLKTCPKSNIF